MNETETNLAESKTKCKQMSEEITEHLDMIKKLNGTMEKLKVSHGEEVTSLKGTIDEKLSEINGLTQEVEKCKESINTQSQEIEKLSGSNNDRKNSIEQLEANIQLLNKNIEQLKEVHSLQIDDKENSIQNFCFKLLSIPLHNYYFNLKWKACIEYSIGFHY